MAGDGPILETRLVAPAPPAPAPAVVDRRFTVGGVLSKTLAAWWRHLAPFTALSLAVYAPLSAVFGALFGAALATAPNDRPGTAFFARLGIALATVWVVTVVLAVVQAGAVTYATVRDLNGERASFREMLGAGLRRAPPVVVTGLLVWIAVLLGTLLLVVPGVILMVATSLALPATVVERPGARGAFRRSLALTRGRRWPLFAAGLVVLVVVWLLAGIVQVGATAAVALVLPPRFAMAALLVSSQLGNALLSPLPLVALSVAYHDLRVEKEGLDTATLARVFE
jgi:hypothetical protein